MPAGLASILFIIFYCYIVFIVIICQSLSLLLVLYVLGWLCKAYNFLLLLQGPPGTGKTSAIIAIISALLAKHYVPPNPKSKQPLPGAPSYSPALDAPDPSPSSSLLPLPKPKQVLPGSVSVADGDDPSASAGQGTSKGRAGAGTTPASAPAPKFRILVCAQSNAAIDEVIARLASPGLLMGESSTYTNTSLEAPHATHGVETASRLYTKHLYCIYFHISHSLHDSSLPK